MTCLNKFAEERTVCFTGQSRSRIFAVSKLRPNSRSAQRLQSDPAKHIPCRLSLGAIYPFLYIIIKGTSFRTIPGRRPALAWVLYRPQVQMRAVTIFSFE